MAADLSTRRVDRTYRAMSCTAHAVVLADRPGPLLDHVGRRLAELERRWSRFLPESEISALNAADGTPRSCSPDTVALVTALVQAWHLTDGDFDPTLLPTLVGLGYAVSRADATRRTSLSGAPLPIGRPDQVLVDPQIRVIELPSGTTLDPGGLGKGLAADLLVAELLDAGADGALVEVGGDVRVAGHAPGDAGWCVAIGPLAGGPSAVVRLRDGGVATSSARLRTWRAGSAERHHLIDPRSLAPTAGDVIASTVVAGTAATAEAFTKVAFVRGSVAARTVFDRHGLAARIISADGTVHVSNAWERFAP